MHKLILIILLVSCKQTKHLTKQKNITNEHNNKTFNVKDFGAKGDFIHDDTKAIQNCFNAIQKNGNGIAYFPNGTYKISRTTIPGKSWCLKGVNNIAIKGESKENTILKLSNTQKNFTRMLILDNNHDIKIKNITFHGNLSNQKNPTDPNEHLGGIFIDQSNNVSISNSNFINTGGDGIGIRGVKIPSKNIKINDCYFDNNQRNGITLGSGFDGVIISNNEFGKHIDDSPIDTEPSGGICQNVKIENNLINTPTLLTLGGASYKNLGRNFVVQNNTLNNCSIFMVRADSVIIKNNTLNIEKSRKSAITCLSGNNAIYIDNNDIKIKNNNAFYFIKTQHSKLSPKNINVVNNKINVFGKYNAFDIRGANNIKIANNQVIGENSKNGVYCFSNYKMNNIIIENNKISGFATGIKLLPLKNNAIKNVSIINNEFQSSKNNNLKIGIDYKYFGRKNLNLLENLSINSNRFLSDIAIKIKK